VRCTEGRDGYTSKSLPYRPSRRSCFQDKARPLSIGTLQGRGSGAAGWSRGGRRPGARAEPYDRNKFMQANFRFLVSDAADLGAHHRDADLMLKWGDVLEVTLLLC